MIVPAGVSWSSDSGVFLSAVPEGKVASYLLVGLGLLVFVHRRGSRDAVGVSMPGQALQNSTCTDGALR
jgi:hypothetical protein